VQCQLIQGEIIQTVAFRVAFFLDAELEEFIEQVINANNRGVPAEKNVTVDPSWDFGASLFFASSVLTTIGKDAIVLLFVRIFALMTARYFVTQHVYDLWRSHM